MSTPETTYYQDGSIMVTNARAVLGSKTYAMANITSVSMGVISANRTPGIVVAAIGGFLTLCCGCSALAPLGSLGYSNNIGDSSSIIGSALFAGIGALIGLLTVAGGVALAIMSKPTYVVKIGSASGEANALTSQNETYIAEIVNAMNEAIIKRG